MKSAASITKQSSSPFHCLSHSVLFISFFAFPFSIQSPLRFACALLCRREMEEKKRWKIPPFGNWEYFDVAASQPGLIRTGFFAGDGLFTLPVAVPAKSASAYPYCVHCHRKFEARKGNGVGVEKRCSKDGQQREEGSVGDVTAAIPRPRRAPMAVDEDLYKIPPELLYTKPKRERVLRNLLWGCMGGLTCIR